MATIAGAQSAFAAWQQAMAAATGGKVFTTHGCTWVWHPVRARLMLLFPQFPDDAGLRPGLAEGTRLGAKEVSVWLNAAADGSALTAFGFSDASPILWHAGQLNDASAGFSGSVRLGADLPEATGADAEELRVALAWRGSGTPGGTDGATRQRVEHATARTQDGQLVGRGFARYTEAGDMALHGLAVAPAHRRQGAGRAVATALARAFEAPAGPQDSGPSGGDGQTAEDPPRRIDVVAGSSPGSSGFLTACGLQLIGRGRHLLLRGPSTTGTRVRSTR